MRTSFLQREREQRARKKPKILAERDYCAIRKSWGRRAAACRPCALQDGLSNHDISQKQLHAGVGFRTKLLVNPTNHQARNSQRWNAVARKFVYLHPGRALPSWLWFGHQATGAVIHGSGVVDPALASTHCLGDSRVALCHRRTRGSPAGGHSCVRCHRGSHENPRSREIGRDDCKSSSTWSLPSREIPCSEKLWNSS